MVRMYRYALVVALAIVSAQPLFATSPAALTYPVDDVAVKDTAAAAEIGAIRGWSDRVFLDQTDPLPPPIGLVVRRQDYDALGLGKSCRQTVLKIDDKPYRHGLGTHSTSEILVRLPKPAKQFVAEVGVDFGWPGSVVFAVEIAGKEVFKSNVLKAGAPALPVRVDLAGAREFILRVTAGGDGSASDHADWADASVSLADGTSVWLDALPVMSAKPLLADSLPFSFVYDGKPSSQFLASWKRSASGVATTTSRETRTVTFADPATKLEVSCEATFFTEFSAVEWVLRFRNAGTADTPIIENIRPLDLQINAPTAGNIVFHHSKGSVCGFDDFLPIDEMVGPNADIRLSPNGGRSSDGALPFFNLQWPHGGLVGAIGWSGQWALNLRRDAAVGLCLQAGQQTTHFTLHPGESVRTPRILVMLWRGDDAMRGHNRFRRLMLTQYLPKRNGQLAVAPTTWNSWFSFNEGNGVDEANQLDWIARTAKTGMECYWLDAGWFEGGWPAGAGSWIPSAKQFPNGLRPLDDAARKANMQFVLWLEPERVTPQSRIAKEHPEWVLHAGQGDGLLNIGNPQARVWLTDHFSRSFKEWGVDVFRIDFNIDPLRFWTAADTPDRQGITEMRHVEGVYQFWDELVKRQPGLTIDNCASGGRRIDLETISRSYPLWRSDSPCGSKAWPVTDQIQVAGLSLYVPQHTGGVWAVDPYTFRSAATMGASLCMDVRDKRLSPNLTRQAIAEIKELRPLYYGDYYPLFDIVGNERVWCGWQFDRPELGRGFAVALRRPQSPYGSANLTLRGLDLKAKYTVEFRETYETSRTQVMTGEQLTALHVAINAAPGSILIVYRKIAHHDIGGL